MIYKFTLINIHIAIYSLQIKVTVQSDESISIS